MKFVCVLLLFAMPLMGFDKVVIWGHKLGSHTHSYIHYGFHKAFTHLGYETYWFDNNDDVSNFDFSGSLFITEGQVDENIPLRDDCLYWLHNIRNREKYLPFKLIYFQVYTHDVLTNPNTVKVDNFIYYDLPGKCFYMPWATDLLPHEIDEVKVVKPTQKRVYWIGTIGDGRFGNREQLNPFIQACNEYGLEFIHIGNATMEENFRLIQESYIAPTIVGHWQFEKGYIPCRIFKNISYGKMGVTNSKASYDLFEQKIIYNPDTYQLFYDAQKEVPDELIYELMDMVKTKHTYINRIQVLLNFFNLVNE